MGTKEKTLMVVDGQTTIIEQSSLIRLEAEKGHVSGYLKGDGMRGIGAVAEVVKGGQFDGCALKLKEVEVEWHEGRDNQGNRLLVPVRL